jgi:cytoskeletal protein CcmA (bactofilin family)
MFRKHRTPNISTVIGRGVEVHGDVKFVGGLHVDGVIKGNVSGDSQTDSTLVLSDTGSIKGEVRVVNLILNGAITGDVYVSGQAELATDAKLTGTLYYQFLEMAMGAEVNGQLVHLVDVEKHRLSFPGEALEHESPKRLAGPE